MRSMTVPALALAVSLWASCGGDGSTGKGAESPAARVFLVGVDGASWDVLDPAMSEGRMPHLERLVSSGSRGVLHSMEPTASAILWTTLATGKVPDKHGIRSFVVPGRDGAPVPVTSNLRRVKAIWNIASEAGLEVGFLGWWVTWPAEPVLGFMASDYTWPLKKDERGFATGVDPELRMPARTHPPELIGELERFVRTESNLTAGELEALGIAGVPKVQGYAVRDMMLKDVSLGEMVGDLLGRYDPSVFAVYFDGLDAYCHLFWPVYKRHLDARASDPSGSASLNARERALVEAIELHLERLDGYLGEIMAHARDSDAVIVLSDHGYGDNPGRASVLRGYGEWIRPSHWHTLEGVVAAGGGPIRRGATPEEATVLDVTPTVLALLGLPVAKDMDGRVLTELISDEYLADHPLRWVETYETGERGEDEPRESPYDEEVLERLRSLGYLD